VTVLAARVPDPPKDLANDVVVTAQSVIGLTWSPDYDGGSPIIDYRIFSD
jgi:hypothetical protein